MDNYFSTLNGVNVSEHLDKKGKFNYVSWVWAWKVVKEYFPDANYTVYENEDGWNYHTDGRTAWVKTGVTINGIEHIEFLPIMDYNNKAVPLEKVDSMLVNKAIQRSITKAIARHGLGLYVYAGEDLPEESDGKNFEANVCCKCGQKVKGTQGNEGEFIPAADVIKLSLEKTGKVYCAEHLKEAVK